LAAAAAAAEPQQQQQQQLSAMLMYGGGEAVGSSDASAWRSCPQAAGDPATCTDGRQPQVLREVLGRMREVEVEGTL
jgi:hypothetical protein